jgi:hypothetical protein
MKMSQRLVARSVAPVLFTGRVRPEVELYSTAAALANAAITEA